MYELSGSESLRDLVKDFFSGKPARGTLLEEKDDIVYQIDVAKVTSDMLVLFQR